MAWVWTIHGEPVAKGRPRFSTRGKFPVAFTPAKTRQAEQSMAAAFASDWRAAPLDVAVALDVVAVFSRPKRLMRAKDPAGRVPHVARPDADNVLKAVSDALEAAGVLRNDSQVAQASTAKVYAAKDEGPRVEVRIEVLGMTRELSTAV